MIVRAGEVCGLLLVMSLGALSQTTEGIITGRLFDAATGGGLSGGAIVWQNQATGETRSEKAAPDGSFTLQRLSPGTYWLRAEICPDRSPAAGGFCNPSDFRPREAYELELHVAGRLELDIPMRRVSESYNSGPYAGAYVPAGEAIVHVYTADFESIRSEPLDLLLGRNGALFSTLSYVVNPQEVRELPLSGRDTYTMLVALPGVTADNSTARGLGLSINGQRSSSSNFLLDGLENNDRLLTGPLTALPPEAIEEYRVSTNNYSAEFGRTGGFVANAITRAGDNGWHGVVYGDLNDTVLNANSFEHKDGLNTSTGFFGATLPRQPQTAIQAGFWTGGPLVRNRAFWSAAYERLRSRSEGDPFPYQAPILSRFETCFPASKATSLLRQFRPPTSPNSTPDRFNCSELAIDFPSSQPLAFDRHTALVRGDFILSEKQRILGRLAISRFEQPDFIYSLYPGLSSTLQVNSTNLALAHLWAIGQHVSNEFRVGARKAVQGWDRPEHAIPAALVLTNRYPFVVSVPGSDASYAFHYGANSGEISEVLSIARGRQVWTFGAGALINRADSLMTFRRDGYYRFNSVRAFAEDTPGVLQISLDRLLAEKLVQPDYSRAYSNNQLYGFAQASLKLSRRFGINAGLRFEYFGTVRNTGTLDPYVLPAPGKTIEERIGGARLVPGDGAHRALYRPDWNNWAPRLGFFYDLSGDWRTVFRGGYGIFYDRPFENLTISTRNNSLEQVDIRAPAGYPNPSMALIPGVVPQRDGVPGALWVDANLRTPYVQSWFAGIQHQVSRALYAEASAQGALARKLISTDLVNRRYAGSADDFGHLSLQIPRDLYFRSNAGSSSYAALTALARYTGRRALFQAAYTWSHSIDNQSDPLQGTFDDLQISRSTNVNRGFNAAGFTREFDASADRASSDFDQRHNLVVFSMWRIGAQGQTGWRQALLADWQIAEIAGFRSGFPYNLITGGALPACSASAQSVSPVPELERPRPSLLPGRQALYPSPIPVPGGFKIVDASAFCKPPNGVLGTLGRNSLIGPGFWNIDLSVAKAFHSRRFGETRSLQFRADWFNAFNHGNLGNPNGVVNSDAFGVALIGRQGVQPSFPSAAPLDQLARQIHLQLKFIF